MRCHSCGQQGATNKCSRCHRVVYCDRECQKAEWKDHKKVCVEAKEAQPESILAQQLAPLAEVPVVCLNTAPDWMISPALVKSLPPTQSLVCAMCCEGALATPDPRQLSRLSPLGKELMLDALNRGADPHVPVYQARNDKGIAAFERAVAAGKRAVEDDGDVEYLGAALMIALTGFDMHTVQLILEHSQVPVKPKTRVERAKTNLWRSTPPIHEAIQREAGFSELKTLKAGDGSVFKALVKAGYSVNEPVLAKFAGPRGVSGIRQGKLTSCLPAGMLNLYRQRKHILPTSKWIPLVRLFAAEGLDLNAVDSMSEGAPLLHQLADTFSDTGASRGDVNDSLDCLVAVLEAGADPDVLPMAPQPALRLLDKLAVPHVTSQLTLDQKKRVLRALKAANASFVPQDTHFNFGLPDGLQALSQGYANYLSLAVQLDSSWLLHFALSQGGVDPNLRTAGIARGGKEKLSLLHQAVSQRSIRCLRVLVECGADVLQMCDVPVSAGEAGGHATKAMTPLQCGLMMANAQVIMQVAQRKHDVMYRMVEAGFDILLVLGPAVLRASGQPEAARGLESELQAVAAQDSVDAKLGRLQQEDAWNENMDDDMLAKLMLLGSLMDGVLGGVGTGGREGTGAV